ncbi:glucan 1,4-alpha-glucosidase [Marinibactrum halimedae]|uniref:Glucoamylase n=1 Tax=Marinibactrum halimedae TaxID=1444977 RepID=A0AA37WMI8_9GAMM|nr:glucan 1,4-alpha-glucosidase [Marinibactrum halimedae]MCD9459218.1 glucan 1,4-alpha-glucosidase [Marinibactrum halimedae]GLS27289.1 glucoamylase [Marinibactrum halimedae]
MNKNTLFICALMVSIGGCANDRQIVEHGMIEQQAKGSGVGKENVAPGAPGADPVWAFSGKTGIGTSYEAYVDGAYQSNPQTGAVSKVWFSIANGIVTETMWGLIHQAQIKDMQYVIVGQDRSGKTYVDREETDTDTTIEYLHTDNEGRPLSLAYKITNRDKEGLYTLEKHIFTDPDRPVLFMRTHFVAHQGNFTPYLIVDPHVNNDGINDSGWVSADGLYAADGNVMLGIHTSAPFTEKTVGFAGISDPFSDLKDGYLDVYYTTSGKEKGNVLLGGALPPVINGKETVIDTVLAFGRSESDIQRMASETLQQGYEKTLAHYNGVGDAMGWEDYLKGLSGLDAIKDMAMDGGKLAHVSALVLKAQEDKTHAGALIASLSNPWGDTVLALEKSTGYKAVWPRDFYQCAMALLALGDTETPKVAFEYLKQVQVSESTPLNKGDGGWFLQKSHVDGQIEWWSVQLDQTAMPIMLAWKLWKAGVLNEEEARYWYHTMLKPAANFLVSGGQLNLDWNTEVITPPITQQERWEEQSGYSPSSTAALIAGLVVAADFAEFAGEAEFAQKYLQHAKAYSANIEKYMFTTQGVHNHNGQYYLRITQNEDPNDNGMLLDRNGRGELKEKEILDAGFLELVRYGVRESNDPYIIDSLEELDDTTLPDNLKVKYEFTFEDVDGVFSGWRRYGNDGYGEDMTNGANYGQNGMTPGQRGRVWPFFTGERGHYELAKILKLHGDESNTESPAIKSELLRLRQHYVQAMELFANEGLMLPEQVWDGIGVNPGNKYQKGEGTNSATPLAWTHAEYIKLLRSITDQAVWDHYPLVTEALNREDSASVVISY